MNIEADLVKFSNWIDSILAEDLPENIVAYNLNIYEEANCTYGLQLIGADSFDIDDEDWVCTDYFTTGEDICYIERLPEIEEWELGLEYVRNMVKEYLSSGKKRDIMLSSKAVGVGFVDGDVHLVYLKNI